MIGGVQCPQITHLGRGYGSTVTTTMGPTMHTEPPAPPSRDRLLTDIADAADALTDPYQLRSPRHYWDEQRHKKPLDDHVVTMPGLIQQLREMTEPGSGEEGPGVRAIPDSRPPLAIDAVSLLAAIEYGAAKRCLDLRVAVRDSAESNIRALVGHARQMDHDPLRVVLAELRSWRTQAEVICRWRTGAVELIAPCPALLDDGRVCGARGSLLANPDTHAARCVTCGTEWAPDQFELLAGHVRRHRDATRAEAERVKGEIRARKAAAAEALDAARQARTDRQGAA